jgi:ABC-type dipeptide/oligopeptide/nickel transport system permease component
MLPRLFRRLSTFAVILLAMSYLIFALESFVPQDPARLALGPSAPLSEVIVKRHELGLDQPMLVRYGRYLVSLRHLDFGTSMRTHHRIASDLKAFLPASLELAFVASAMGVPLGLLYGVSSLLSPRTAMLRLLLISLSSLPIFLTGLALLDTFWFHLGWLPSGGRTSLDHPESLGGGFIWFRALLEGRIGLFTDASAHLVLPACTLMLPVAVGVGRTFATSLQTVRAQLYIRTARAKGLSEWQIFARHMLRNSAPPVLAMIGLQIAILLANLVIVEQLFAWPGLGYFAAQAIGSADVPAIQGASLAFASVYIAASAIVDVLQVLCVPD